MPLVALPLLIALQVSPTLGAASNRIGSPAPASSQCFQFKVWEGSYRLVQQNETSAVLSKKGCNWKTTRQDASGWSPLCEVSLSRPLYFCEFVGWYEDERRLVL